MEAVSNFEMYVHLYQTTQHHIPSQSLPRESQILLQPALHKMTKLSLCLIREEWWHRCLQISGSAADAEGSA